MSSDFRQLLLQAFGEPNPHLSTRNQWRFGRNGSISANLHESVWYDHEAGEGGGHITLKKRLGLFDESLPWTSTTISHRSNSHGADDTKKAKKRAWALKIWNETQPINGTFAETYLREARGITCDLPDDLRFHPHCLKDSKRQPAMVGLIRNIHTNEPQGIHRTFLKPNGSGRDGEKKMLGVAKDGVIKLSTDEEVGDGLGIGEGIETCLSIMSQGWKPLWVALSAGGIRRFPVLDGMDALTVFADAEPAGINAARECAIRWAENGREAQIAAPRLKYGDWNDVFRRAA